MSESATTRLTQLHRLCRERGFELVGNRHLRVAHRSPRQNQDYTIELLGLSAQSRRRVRVPWRWLAVAVTGAALHCAWLASLDAPLSPLAALYALPLGLASALPALAGLAMFVVGIERSVVFVGRYSGVPLVEIWTDVGNRRRREAFLGELELRVGESLRASGAGPEQLRAGELRMIRRLMGEGVVDEATYERAKAILLTRPDRAAAPAEPGAVS